MTAAPATEPALEPGTEVPSAKAPTEFPFASLTADAGAAADPVLVEIVQGSLASVEMEVETAIGRTSRSPSPRRARTSSTARCCATPAAA